MTNKKGNKTGHKGREKGDKADTMTNKKGDKRKDKADTVTNKKGDKTGDKGRQKGDKEMLHGQRRRASSDRKGGRILKKN